MKLSEISLSVAANGSLLVPSSIIREMGLHAGDIIWIAYLTPDGAQNTFREFFLSPDGIDRTADPVPLQLPDILLQQANLDADDDIKIMCLNGCIAIFKDCDLDDAALADILDSLRTANILAPALSTDPQSAQDQLSEIVNELTERRGDV